MAQLRKLTFLSICAFLFACSPELAGDTDNSTVNDPPTIAQPPPSTSQPPATEIDPPPAATTQPPVDPAVIPDTPGQNGGCNLGGLLELGLCIQLQCGAAGDLINCIQNNCGQVLAALGQPCVNCLQNIVQNIGNADLNLQDIIGQCTN